MTSKYPIGAILQECAIVGNRKGWYPCDGREIPTELKTNGLVMSILEKHGYRLPDLRPGKWLVYLGGPKMTELEQAINEG